MRLIKTILLSLMLAGLVPAARCAEAGSATPPAEQTQTAEPAAKNVEEHQHEHGLSPGPNDIFTIPLGPLGSFPVSNSMFVTWIVALGIIIFARIATRRMKEVPDGAQNFLEWLVEGLYNFLESILGPKVVKTTFWFFLTIFIFILFTNWFGLIPGVGTIFYKGHPLLRGGNADLNMTSAMALIFMVLWLFWSLRFNGLWHFLLHIFGPKGESTGFIKYMMIVIFFLVGFLEVISIAFRPVSLSFRLYGNVFAGENLLEAMSGIVQNPPWARAVFSVLLPIPFYFLEILVGLVQAFVFMLLTTVFTALMCSPEDEHGKEPAKEGHH